MGLENTPPPSPSEQIMDDMLEEDNVDEGELLEVIDLDENDDFENDDEEDDEFVMGEEGSSIVQDVKDNSILTFKEHSGKFNNGILI